MPKVQLISGDERFTIGDTECWFTIRRLDPGLVHESRRRHTRPTGSQGPRQLGLQECNEEEVDRDILDYIIQDWSGVLGLDGAEVPCTRENKWRLPESIKIQILIAAKAINTDGLLADDLKALKPSAGQGASASAEASGA